MTSQRSFKRLVRSRMEKTGESYTTARAMLLAPPDEPPRPGAVAGVLTVPDDAIRRRTGEGWEHWFDVLDDWGATDRRHGEIAAWLQEEHGVDGWGAQAITVSYERARGMREVGERADGFAVSASKTVAVPVERLFLAFADEEARRRWLPDGDLRERTALPHRTLRYDWEDGTTRVNVFFTAKGDAKSTATVSHERLADASEAARMKAWWRERVSALKAELES
jgi:uncharacterized protein YndB with AHSA1/START domain